MLIKKLIEHKEKFIKIVIVSIFSYFTFWVLLLNVGYYLHFLRKYQFSILLLNFTISFFGFFLINVYPKKIIVPVINYKLNDIESQIMDLLFHHLPLLIFVFSYNPKIKRDNLYLFFLTIFIYLLFNDPIKLYHI